jgi:hypothetical protein
LNFIKLILGGKLLYNIYNRAAHFHANFYFENGNLTADDANTFVNHWLICTPPLIFYTETTLCKDKYKFKSKLVLVISSCNTLNV